MYYDTMPLERLSLALVASGATWRNRHLAPPSIAAPQRAMTVAIARDIGASGELVARAVGAKLGWPVYDHELVEHVAAKLAAPINVAESVDEKRVSWLQEIVEAVGRVPPVSEARYVRRVIEDLQSLAERGACVLVGRGAAHILPHSTTLSVRVVAERADRIAALARERGLTPREAARELARADRERTRFISEHFHCNPHDPACYDLVINTSRRSVEDCATLIIQALGEPTELAKKSFSSRWPIERGGA